MFKQPGTDGDTYELRMASVATGGEFLSTSNIMTMGHIHYSNCFMHKHNHYPPGNLNFISSAGVEVYSIPSKFQTDCSRKS